MTIQNGLSFLVSAKTFDCIAISRNKVLIRRVRTVSFFLSYNIPSGNAISVVPKKLNVDELTVIPLKRHSLKVIAIEGGIG